MKLILEVATFVAVNVTDCSNFKRFRLILNRIQKPSVNMSKFIRYAKKRISLKNRAVFRIRNYKISTIPVILLWAARLIIVVNKNLSKHSATDRINKIRQPPTASFLRNFSCHRRKTYTSEERLDSLSPK